MHFTQIFTIALLAAGQVSSAAVPASRDVLIERANPSPQAVICGPSNNQQKYTKDAVKKAYDKGKKYWKDDDYSHCYNNNCYPKEYKANGGNVRSKLPKECDPNAKGSMLAEWPIMASGDIWAGKVNPDTDRIIMYAPDKNGNTVIFCGVMSHRGLGGSNFNWCEKDT